MDPGPARHVETRTGAGTTDPAPAGPEYPSELAVDGIRSEASRHFQPAGSRAAGRRPLNPGSEGPDARTVATWLSELLGPDRDGCAGMERRSPSVWEPVCERPYRRPGMMANRKSAKLEPTIIPWPRADVTSTDHAAATRSGFSRRGTPTFLMLVDHRPTPRRWVRDQRSCR